MPLHKGFAAMDPEKAREISRKGSAAFKAKVEAGEAEYHAKGYPAGDPRLKEWGKKGSAEASKNPNFGGKGWRRNDPRTKELARKAAQKSGFNTLDAAGQQRMREAARAASLAGAATMVRTSHPFNPRWAREKDGHIVNKTYHNFAAKIREATQDGWELVDAVYQVFTRARDTQNDALTIEAATWLADRGFGKPVQVTQLTDGQSNTMAFMIWQPATAVGLPASLEEAIEDQQNIITLERVATPSGVPAARRLPPPSSSLERGPAIEGGAGASISSDAYAAGIARPWSAEKSPSGAE